MLHLHETMSASLSGPGTVAVISRPGVRYVYEPPFDPPNPVYEMVEAVSARSASTAGAPARRSGIRSATLIHAGRPRAHQAELRHLEELRGASARREAGLLVDPRLGAAADPRLRAAGRAGRGARSPSSTRRSRAATSKRWSRGWGCARSSTGIARAGSGIDFIDLRHFRVVPHMALDDVQAVGRSWNLGLLLRERLPGDPLGYTVVDLGERSWFDEVKRRGPRFCFHRSHKHTPVPHHIARPAGVFDPAHGARRRRGHQHPQAEDPQEVGRDAGAQVVHRAHQREVLAAPLHRRDAGRGRRRVSRSRRRSAVRLENQLQRFPLPLDHSLIARAPRSPMGARKTAFSTGCASWRAAGRETTPSGARCSI